MACVAPPETRRLLSRVRFGVLPVFFQTRRSWPPRSIWRSAVGSARLRSRMTFMQRWLLVLSQLFHFCRSLLMNSVLCWRSCAQLPLGDLSVGMVVSPHRLVGGLESRPLAGTSMPLLPSFCPTVRGSRLPRNAYATLSAPLIRCVAATRSRASPIRSSCSVSLQGTRNRSTWSRSWRATPCSSPSIPNAISCDPVRRILTAASSSFTQIQRCAARTFCSLSPLSFTVEESCVIVPAESAWLACLQSGRKMVVSDL